MPPSGGGDDVTLAVLGTKLDNLRDVVVPLRDYVEGIEARVRAVEDKTSRLEERMTLWQAFQAGYATVTAAIAAFLGTR
jgi:hypothetical protein